MKIIKKTVVILIPPILSFFIAFFGLFISSYLESIFYEQLFPNLQGNLFVSLIMDVFFFLMISFLFILLTKIIYKDIRILGFSKKNFFKNFFFGYLTGAFIITFIVAGYVLVGGADFQEVFSKSSWSKLLISIVFYLAQGSQEEVISRGFVLGGIAKKTNLLWGVIVSSLFFMLMHLSNTGGFTLELLDYFLIGMVWALLRILFSNTWVAAASHGAYNFFMSDFFGLANSPKDSEGILFQTIYHSSIDYMSIIISSIVLVILIILVWRKRNTLNKPLEFE
ncbi:MULTISPECIES: CPBP family intramembrane glutamic endopeptidase [Enterococcus]|uniref:CPBP family intramembrane glutamic endopeptidase n=1 Tax=Enterococcus TaxID=1350 RepID=UPI000DFA71EE|nr:MULTISPECIES: type II CAAX endopeptidase family protein [Enterococcus]EME8231228.1 CPBP family intramembrane metalloprotease [Enterococcus faecium]MDG4566095.1 type II CAAX endopeptidase family protein [Enterococcus faecium]MDG4571634.1 type II CAAX endopeptidase family protein [Enterococcus faecium]MDG4589677.1 type II CAAX endopeptidase family protein [Enterococcus faecium]MDT2313862.1 type II CAAX endopeptidase family protein [Enterococcus faecium]